MTLFVEGGLCLSVGQPGVYSLRRIRNFVYKVDLYNGRSRPVDSVVGVKQRTPCEKVGVIKV